MHKAVGLFILAAAAIVGAWAWLGQAVPMPPSPLDPGEKLYCVSYAPFRGAQTPLDLSTTIAPAQIEQDLAQLAQLTSCVRTYSVDFGLDRVPEIAQRHGLKVLLGLWVSSHADRTEYQLRTGVELARQYPEVVRAVVVGNEALLRGEVSAERLGEYIRGVKSQIALPVTYADVWEFWLRHRALASAVDFVTVHILPYWEDDPIGAAGAASHIDDIRKRVVAEFPGKEIVIGEVGWPSAGRMREGALPSPVNQARVLHRHLDARQARRLPRQSDRGLRPAVEAPSRRHRRRPLGLVRGRHAPAEIHLGRAGVQSSALAAASGGRRRARGAGVCGGVVRAAARGGGFDLWRVGRDRVECRGRRRARGLDGGECAGGKPRRRRLAALARVRSACHRRAGRGRRRPGDARPRCRRSRKSSGRSPAACAMPLALTLGLALLALTVLALQSALALAFDPRYRDFPFAPLTAAAVPFLLLALVAPRGRRAQGGRGNLGGRRACARRALHRVERDAGQLAGAVVCRRELGSSRSVSCGRGPRQAEDQQRRGERGQRRRCRARCRCRR